MPYAASLASLLRQSRRPILARLAPLVSSFAGFTAGVPNSLAATGDVRPIADLASRDALVEALDRRLRSTLGAARRTAALVIEIDDWKLLEERHEHAVLDQVRRVTAARLVEVLDKADMAARLDGPCFALLLAPTGPLDLESALRFAGRLQRHLGEPVPFGDAALPLTVSIGLALPKRLDSPTSEGLLRAATLAILEAQRTGPGTVRSYSEAMRVRVQSRGHLVKDVAAALERREVLAHFQPQISARTGVVSGFETLARWHHPSRGLLPPSEFLPAIEQAGLMGRLGQRMLEAGLTALREWEAQGLYVPSVAINLSGAELGDPSLVERIAWELDHFDLTPDRLVLEVLETVVATRNAEVVIQTLAGLARLGCCLDLDDFGTGQASISSIRRFSIERIKIDRSFVTHIDQDTEQQRMVSAILTMAERLGLDTVAEGVETAGEQAMLTRLGCGHLQGFGIARPMPFSDTGPWLRTWSERGAPAARQLRVV